MKNQNDFLKAFGISDEKFKMSKCNWANLTSIEADYVSRNSDLIPVSKSVLDVLQSCDKVHSIKSRVKDSEHLIEKIVRKCSEKPDRTINLSNYRVEITDLIGVRAIHLFKSDWKQIHDFILGKWNPIGAPVANIRRGDPEDDFKKAGCEIAIHDRGYRSVHYLIEVQLTKEKFTAEIQVRSIFEEGWSEIDHLFRYPNKLEDPIMNSYLNVFNVHAGNADLMANTLMMIQSDLTQKEKTIESLKAEVRKLKIDAAEREKMLRQIDRIIEPYAGYGVLGNPNSHIAGSYMPYSSSILGVNPFQGISYGSAQMKFCLNCRTPYPQPSVAIKNDSGYCPTCEKNLGLS